MLPLPHAPTIEASTSIRPPRAHILHATRDAVAMKKRRRSPASRTAAAERRHAAEHAVIQRRMRQIRALRAEFRDLHKRGTAALKQHDYSTLGKIIAAENRVIVKQRQLVEKQGVLIERRLAHAKGKLLRRSRRD